MGKLSDKELQEFWEWCGLYQERESGGLRWFDSQGFLIEEPELDLSNLFKYAMPKGFETLGEDKMHGLLIGWIHSIIYYPETARKEPTQALYKAIQKAKGKG